VVAEAPPTLVAWGRRVRKRTILGLLAGGVLLADQVTKAAVATAVPPGYRVPVLGDVLAIHHLSNTGAALGFQAARPAVVIGLALSSVALLLLLFWFLPVGRPNRLLATALAIGGGLGNLLDRVRIRGVMDFLEISIAGFSLPVFNLADIAVMTGAVWLAWSIWWDERKATALGSSAQG